MMNDEMIIRVRADVLPQMMMMMLDARAPNPLLKILTGFPMVPIQSWCLDTPSHQPQDIQHQYL